MFLGRFWSLGQAAARVAKGLSAKPRLLSFACQKSWLLSTGGCFARLSSPRPLLFFLNPDSASSTSQKMVQCSHGPLSDVEWCFQNYPRSPTIRTGAGLQPARVGRDARRRLAAIAAEIPRQLGGFGKRPCLESAVSTGASEEHRSRIHRENGQLALFSPLLASQQTLRVRDCDGSEQLLPDDRLPILRVPPPDLDAGTSEVK